MSEEAPIGFDEASVRRIIRSVLDTERRRKNTLRVPSSPNQRTDIEFIQLEGTLGNYDPTTKVGTLTGLTIAHPTGARNPASVQYVFNKYNLSLTGIERVWCIYEYKAYDDTNEDNTYGRVDWVILPFEGGVPATVVTVDRTSLSQSAGDMVLPVTGTSGMFSGNIAGTPIWILLLDSKLHASSGIEYKNNLWWLPALANLIGIPYGSWSPDTGTGTGENWRPVYAVEHPGWGLHQGFVGTGTMSASNYGVMDSPIFGTGKVYVYLRDAGGDYYVSEPITALNTLPKDIPPGTLVFLSPTPLGLSVLSACDVGTGFSTWANH